MTVEREGLRFVDAHVHHWDPANTEWYPHLAPDFDLAAVGVAGADRMKRRYLLEDYLADVQPWGIDKYVHVNATPAPKAYLEEGHWVVGLGGPVAAVVGTVDLEQDREEVIKDLQRQAELAQFRGIRNMHIPDPADPLFGEVLEFLRDRELVYDFVVHPETMTDAARAVRRVPGLSVVVEHTGWPTATHHAHREQWRAGMRELAAIGPTVNCKITGLAMTTHTLDPAVNRPWLQDALDIFGVERCLAGTNMPVDGVFGGVDVLMRTYLELLDGHGPGALEAVLATNAERVYRI
jgi:predicted TIM-barrel fold metal-dependent hydrolase